MEITKSQTWNDLCDIVEEIVSVDKDSCKPSTKLNEFGMEPLDSAVLVVEIESKFDITYPDVEWENAKTLEDVYRFIVEHRKEQKHEHE